MGKLRRTLAGAIMLALLVTPTGLGALPVRAADEASGIGTGLVYGLEAQEMFEALARDGAVTFEDFERVPIGPLKKLRLDGPGITIRLRTTQIRIPLPKWRAPKGAPVVVLPDHRLMGVAKDGGRVGNYVPDGQSRFELVFSKPVSHVGLMRPWTTDSLTRFYDAAGTLLAKHQNTTDAEFVGYVAAGLGDRVKRVEVDGLPEQPGSKSNKLFQVGQVDDLYLGYGPAGVADEGEEKLSPLDELLVDEPGVAWAGGESQGDSLLYPGLFSPSSNPIMGALQYTLAILLAGQAHAFIEAEDRDRDYPTPWLTPGLAAQIFFSALGLGAEPDKKSESG